MHTESGQSSFHRGSRKVRPQGIPACGTSSDSPVMDATYEYSDGSSFSFSSSAVGIASILDVRKSPAGTTR